MNKEGGELILLLRCSLISSYFMSFHFSLLRLLVVSSRAGLGWKVSSWKISHLGIPIPCSPGWVTGCSCCCQTIPGQFCSAIISIPRWSWGWERSNLNKTKILLFSQLDFSHKTKPNLSGPLGFTNNDQVCIFSAEIKIKNKLWAPEPLLEGIFCVHTLLQI